MRRLTARQRLYLSIKSRRQLWELLYPWGDGDGFETFGCWQSGCDETCALANKKREVWATIKENWRTAKLAAKEE